MEAQRWWLEPVASARGIAGHALQVRHWLREIGRPPVVLPYMKYGDVMGVEYGCRRSREGRLEEKEHGATVICCGGCTRICEGRRRGHLGRYNMKHGMTASKVAQAMELSKKLLSFADAVVVR